MLSVDPERLDLVRAFKANPLGPHDGELSALVTALRLMPFDGKYVLLERLGEAGWELARLHGERYAPPCRLGEFYTDLASAEWAVFRRRWEARTGVPLDIE